MCLGNEIIFLALTCMHGITGREVRWTVALRLILVYATQSVFAAVGVPAEIAAVADADLVSVAVAAWIAAALEAAHGLAALGVDSAWSSKAFVPA